MFVHHAYFMWPRDFGKLLIGGGNTGLSGMSAHVWRHCYNGESCTADRFLGYFAVSAAVLLSACSPYVYKKEVSDFASGVQELAEAYSVGTKSAESDRAERQRETWTTAGAKLTRTAGCTPPVAGTVASTTPCVLQELGAAAPPPPSPILLQAQKGQPILDALQDYATALEAVTNAADREALDGAQAELRQAVEGLASRAGPGLATPAGAVTQLFGLIAANYLDTRRYQVLRAGVLEAQAPVATLGDALGEALDALRTARANELRPTTDRLIDLLGPTTDRGVYADRLKRAEAAVATIDALNKADPQRAAREMVAAHDALMVALRDDTRQIEPVVAAIKAFVAQAKIVRDAFHQRRADELDNTAQSDLV